MLLPTETVFEHSVLRSGCMRQKKKRMNPATGKRTHGSHVATAGRGFQSSKGHIVQVFAFMQVSSPPLPSRCDYRRVKDWSKSVENHFRTVFMHGQHRDVMFTTQVDRSQAPSALIQIHACVEQAPVHGCMQQWPNIASTRSMDVHKRKQHRRSLFRHQ